MYKILADGLVIHDSTSDSIRVLNPVYHSEMGASGRLTFNLAPGNNAYNFIEKMKTEVSLYIRDEWVFSGRVLNDDIPFSNIKKIEVEGELAYLNDSVVRPYVYEGDVRPLVEHFVDSHNSQVTPDRQFTVGIVTVEDPNEMINRANQNYPSTWKEMSDKLSKNAGLGGYFRTRHLNGVRYLDYVNDYGNINDQVINFGVNLLDLDKYVKGQDVATAIVPVGKVIEDGESPEGQSEGKRLTIESVNDGLDYVFDQSAVDKYGWVFHTAIFDDVTVPENLLRKGYETLAKQKLLAITLDVNAVDLNLLDVQVERIKTGDLIKVISEPHGVDEYMTVSKMTLDLTKPENTTIELGSERDSLTDGIHNSIGNTIENVISDYATNEKLTDNIGSAIAEVTQVLTSEISQSANEILLEVSGEYATKTELGEESQVLQSQIQQTEANVDIRFTEVNESISDLDGVVQENQENLETYIRFNIDGMELGKLGSEFTAELSNEELAFLQNGQKVAYINNNKMYITDVEIRNNLALGTPTTGYFDFIPRTNGNLSFKFRG